MGAQRAGKEGSPSGTLEQHISAAAAGCRLVGPGNQLPRQRQQLMRSLLRQLAFQASEPAASRRAASAAWKRS